MTPFYALLIATTGITIIVASADNGQTTEPAERPIFTDETGYTADISSDGRLALVNVRGFGRSSRDLPSRFELRDLATRQTTEVSNGRSPFGRPAAVLSADKRRIAYTWTEPAADVWAPQALRTVMMVADVGGRARVLVPADGNGVVPHGWSPDGKEILALIHGPGASIADPTFLAWVSVSDGSIRKIKTLEPWRSGASAASHPRLSPDGTQIAFSAVAKESSSDRWIYVVDANGQNERVVADAPGTNTFPVWTPDSRSVIFVNGPPSGRRLFMTALARTDPPVELKPNFAGEPLRVTQSGALFYTRDPQNLGFVQMIAQRKSGSFRVQDAFSGVSGVWFRNTTFAFMRPGPQGTDLVIRSSDSAERVIQRPGLSAWPPRWSRDGRSVIVHVLPAGDGGTPGGAFYRVDVNTGAFTRLLTKDTADRILSTTVVVTPDDRTLFASARADARSPWTRIVAIDLATGAERTVTTMSGLGEAEAPGLALDPAASTLAIHTMDGRLHTVRVDGTDSRQLYRPTRGTARPECVEWAADGRSILFVTGGPAAQGGGRLLRISRTGGNPQFEGLDVWRLNSSTRVPAFEAENVRSLDVNEDGSGLAFSSRAVSYYDVWRIDNVMRPSSR